MSLAARLPVFHPYAGGYPGLGSQPAPTDSDAIDYLQRMAAVDASSDGVEVGVAVAVSAFITALKADGLWSSIGSSCLLCGPRTLAGALVPLRGVAPTPNGFVSGDHSRTDGLRDTGGTSYLLTGLGYNEVSANDEHLAMYLSALPGDPQNLIGGGTVSPSSFSRIGYITSQQRYDVQSGDNTVVAGAFALGFVGASRASATGFFRRQNSVTVAVSADSAGTRSDTTTKYGVFCANYSDSGVSGVTTAGMSFYSIGAAVDLAALDSHISSYVTAIGAAI